MKLKTFLIVGCLGGFFALNSCTAPTNEKDYSVFVNPFIGTGGHGHTFPGAVVPHGMIQPSPDTRLMAGTPVQAIIMKTLPLTDSHTRTSVAQDVVTTATYYSCRLSANSDIRPLIRKVSN